MADLLTRITISSLYPVALVVMLGDRAPVLSLGDGNAIAIVTTVIEG